MVQILVDGELVELTPQQEQELIDSKPTDVIGPSGSSVHVIALAELGVENGEVTGIESACGVGFAFMISDGVFWLFFSTPEPDTKYLAFPQTPGFNVDVTAREVDYLEVTVTSRATNEPAIPASLAITVQRTR